MNNNPYRVYYSQCGEDNFLNFNLFKNKKMVFILN